MPVSPRSLPKSKLLSSGEGSLLLAVGGRLLNSTLGNQLTEQLRCLLHTCIESVRHISGSGGANLTENLDDVSLQSHILQLSLSGLAAGGLALVNELNLVLNELCEVGVIHNSQDLDESLTLGHLCHTSSIPSIVLETLCFLFPCDDIIPPFF